MPIRASSREECCRSEKTLGVSDHTTAHETRKSDHLAWETLSNLQLDPYDTLGCRYARLSSPGDASRARLQAEGMSCGRAIPGHQGQRESEVGV